MGLTYEQINSWDCYDNWDDPDPSNYIVITCLTKAICERLSLFDSQLSNMSAIFNSARNAIDYMCYNNFYMDILDGLIDLQTQYSYMKLFTDDSMIDNINLGFEHGYIPNGISSNRRKRGFTTVIL